MACSSLAELLEDLKTLDVDLSGPSPDFSRSTRPPGEMVDRWAETAALAEPEARSVAIWAIREAALAAGIVPASVQELYLACAAGTWSGKTVPAMNLRGWTYQTCRAVFRAASELDSKLFIFEQAVGEALYAQQPPLEYAAGVLAAALREGHEGPVFLQADHDQINAKAYLADPKAEIRKLEAIMREQVAAGLYSIDIDASTVVDLALPTVEDQQRVNAELTAHFTEFVRGIEPEGVTISLGAEIGEVGHENTTPEELRAFMKVYLEEMARRGRNLPIVSKISINSGTYHGGKVLPDGTLAPVNVDYELLRTISTICRTEFDMAGAVQHGASTLPGEQLARFPAAEAVEIHLALGFNNLIFDHPSLPQALKDQIRDYTFAHHAAERAPGETDAQFFYNTRKKSWKVMKQPFWEMPAQTQAEIMASLQTMFRNMFTWMNVGNTSRLVLDNTTAVKVAPPLPEALRKPRAA
ncbi:class II fructose-bisphosphate aldolase [Bosea sp. (in: a-proteobacteria)]|uniref:class II fructose-bisphosphate aldolase n=1 Tax=Bosea sp. (in: a-proteobacteria) TaxID=1871050 RepID=UPI003F6E61E0